MIIKKFNDKKGREVVFRTIVPSDMKRVREFMQFINSVIEEKDFIMLTKKVTFKQEKEWVRKTLKDVKKGNKIHFIAECEGKIIGNCEVENHAGIYDHIAEFSIALDKNYRDSGIGTELLRTAMKDGVKMLKNKRKIRILKIKVYSTNKRAKHVYEKLGFRMVASVPKQIQRKGKLIPELILLKNVR